MQFILCCMLLNFKYMDISEQQRKEYRDKVIEVIKFELSKPNALNDLGDIGNAIGFAVGSITCKNGKDLNIWSFEKDDFESGFDHGYSLKDGSH
jgi:hypothetical protein